MKPAASHVAIAVMGIVIAALTWALVYFARDELGLVGEQYEEEIETAETAGVDDGRAVVRVSAASQAASGIETRPLAPAKVRDSAQVFGTVVNVQPLLELRGAYLAIAGELAAQRSALAAANAEYRRMKLLYEDDRNVSEQALRSAEAAYRAAQAQVGAAEARLAAVGDALRTGWGDVIAGWARAADSPRLKALLDGRLQLVRLSFPYEMPAAAARASVEIAPVTGRDRAVAARLVSAAPQVDSTLPGQTFFYAVEHSMLRAGARVVGAVGTGPEMLEGVLIPDEAVVWYAGKAWVYLRHDAETFGRYAVSARRDLGTGWFDRGQDLVAGREVVTSGAQLLLSEELKFQIRNENED